MNRMGLLRNGFANSLLGTLIVAATMLMTNIWATTVAAGAVLTYLMVGARRLASPWWLLGVASVPLALLLLAFLTVAFQFVRLLW